MKKFLILGLENGIVENVLRKGNIKIYPIYKLHKNFIYNFIWELYYRMNLPKIDIWYGFKHIDLKYYDLIIIFRCRRPIELIKYIRKYNKQCKIIYWLFDTIGTLKSPLFYDIDKDNINLIAMRTKYNFEVWSFDKVDCKKYNLKYNNNFLFQNKNFLNNKIKYDCFFCGFNKGRIKELRELQKILENIKKTYKFLVVKPPTLLKKIKKKLGKTNKNKINNNNGILILEDSIQYDAYLKHLSISKCIVDIVQQHQSGITLRAIESIFYRKKLITNFENIIEYDFYNKNNIFILGKDDISFLETFINSDYDELPEKIIRKYTINGWIENFIKED